MSERILVVDDERQIRDLLGMVLSREGFDDVLTAETGVEALSLVQTASPDLIVLDVMLPDIDGFELAARIRKTSEVTILFLTARDTDTDKLLGFSVGGDDYVTKPFNPLEVVARVKARLRRANDPRSEDALDLGRIVIHERAGRVVVDDQEVAMPAMEFRLLCHLAKNPDRIFSKRQLYRSVWGEEPIGSNDDNTVTVHVRRLREKIEVDPSDPVHLLTVRGMGYKLVALAEDATGESGR